MARPVLLAYCAFLYGSASIPLGRGGGAGLKAWAGRVGRCKNQWALVAEVAAEMAVRSRRPQVSPRSRRPVVSATRALPSIRWVAQLAPSIPRWSAAFQAIRLRRAYRQGSLSTAAPGLFPAHRWRYEPSFPGARPTFSRLWGHVMSPPLAARSTSCAAATRQKTRPTRPR